MPDIEQKSHGGFVFRWVVLCGLGLAAGLAVGLGLSAPIESLVGMMLVTPIALGLAGSIFGSVQWMAIRKNLRVGAIWIGASAAGLGLGMTIGIVLVEQLGRVISGDQVRLFSLGPLGRSIGLASIGLFTGISVGVAQWIGLRTHASVGTEWILRCALAFGVGLPTGGLVADSLPGGLQSSVGLASLFAIAGLVVGVLTVSAASPMADKLSAQRGV